MKNHHSHTKRADESVGRLFALAAFIVAVTIQSATSQTTLNFSGDGAAATAPRSHPVAVSRDARGAAALANPPQTGNEVYIFSFSKQQNIAKLPLQPLPAKDAGQPAAPKSAQAANAAAPGDVYTILAKAWLDASRPAASVPLASQNASVVAKPPAAANENKPSEGDVYLILAQAGREPIAPAVPTPVVAVEPAPLVAAPAPIAPPAVAAAPSDDVFTILAKAGREASTASVLPNAPAMAERRKAKVETASSNGGWRSVLANSSRVASAPAEPAPVSAIAPAELAAPAVASPAPSLVDSSPTVVQPPAQMAVAPPAPAPVDALVVTELPKASVEVAPPVGEAYSKLAENEGGWNRPPEPTPPSTPAIADASPAAIGDRLTLLEMPTTTAITTAEKDASSGGATVVGTVTCNPGTMPFASCDCPHNAGQSGTPSICGVDCGESGAPCCSNWNDARCIPWSLFGPGEYVGPARSEHVSTYYLRVNDLVTLTFIASRQKNAQSYRIGVGDRLRLEWLRTAGSSDAPLDREVMVQPDGTIALPLVGEVTAAGKSVKDLQEEVIRLYGRFQREPQITITPLEVNMALQDLLKAVTSQSRSSGQALDLRVTPEGTIQAPGLGSVYVQGLTLEELRTELEARYEKALGVGMLVSPSLTERATSYVFLGGEVKTPGRYTLEGPTTVMQAITLAGGWNNGGNLHQVVVFRRDENWCLKATKIDVRAPLYGRDPCPVNDVWLRDNDLLIVPKQRILCAADVIELYFTRGVYAVFPITFVRDFSKGSSVVPIGP
ncbi:MAG: polysaccharide biosynthesis/export family protein [Pirellulales bacterium]